MVLTASKREGFWRKWNRILENCNMWSQHVTFYFNQIRALFNHSKPERGVREHFFRTVVQSSMWAPESCNSITAIRYCLLSVQGTPMAERAIKQRSMQRVVVTFFGLYTVAEWCYVRLFLNPWWNIGLGYMTWALWEICALMERKFEARWGYRVAPNAYVYATE